MGSTPRSRARPWAAAGVVALVLGLAGCGAKQAPPYPTPPPGGPRLRDTPLDRTQALEAGAVSVGVAVPQRTAVSVVVRVAGVSAPVAGPLRAEVTGADGLVKVPLTAAGSAALGSCSPAPATVELTAAGGGRLDTRTVAPSDSGPPCGRFFGAAAPWNQELADDAPLDPSSPARVAVLRAELRRELAAHFGPGITVSDYSTPVYTVGAKQPLVDVALPPEKAPYAAPFRRVPLPADAQPAPGTDRHLVLWQPATDTMWEFFGLQRGGGAWNAKWGGRIDGVSRSDGVFHAAAGAAKYGATASGLALAGGLITPGDVRRGSIDHALAVAIPKAMSGAFALPAQRTDGVDRAAAAIPEGARFRLDPTIDIASLKLPPLAKMIAVALQRYGMIVRDQSAVITFYGQIPTAAGGYPEFKRAMAGRFSDQLLAALPWDRLQLLRMSLRRSAG